MKSSVLMPADEAVVSRNLSIALSVWPASRKRPCLVTYAVEVWMAKGHSSPDLTVEVYTCSSNYHMSTRGWTTPELDHEARAI